LRELDACVATSRSGGAANLDPDVLREVPVKSC
jgi:hypothetical protein